MLTIIVLTLVVFAITLVCAILKLQSCPMGQLLRITTTAPYHTSWQCFVSISLLSSSLHSSWRAPQRSQTLKNLLLLFLGGKGLNV